MLRIVKSVKETKECQRILESVLNEQLSSEGEFKIGFPGGSRDILVKYNSSVWFASREITEGSPRFWNVFGLATDLKQGKSNSIVVEINIPTTGINRRVSGMFAIEDETKSVFLLHRGRVGGGRKGIGKNAFVNWQSHKFVEIQNDSEVEQALVVGSISNDDFVNHLEGFVKSISEFKLFATSEEVNDASFLSDRELEEKCKGKNNKPNKKKTITTVYERNPHISELAKRRSMGRCQLCNNEAPFKDKFGKPFLETHHIHWMSDGGEDSIENTIALCPNCHRKMHIVNSKNDVTLLKSIAKP